MPQFISNTHTRGCCILVPYMEQEILTRLQRIEKLLSELQANQPRELLSIDETAKLLNVTRPTLWDWDKKGILKKRHVGNIIRYKRADIDKILNR